MIGKASAVVLAGLLVAAAVVAPDALARRGGGPGGAGYGNCRQQQAGCGCDQDGARQRKRQRDASCPQDPSQCPNREDCPRQGTGPGPQDGAPQDGAGKGAGNR